MNSKLIISLLIVFVLSTFAAGSVYAQTKKEKRIARKISLKLEEYGTYFNDYQALGQFTLDSVAVHKNEKKIQFFFNEKVSYIPLRESIILDEIQKIKAFLGRHSRQYTLEFFSSDKALIDLIPNYYRVELPVDSSHFEKARSKKVLLTRPYEPKFELGLGSKHLALWHSHGLYYEASLDRWEWQRARLHSTVEDMLSMSFVLPYLNKMLENAGAITFIPRERDLNTSEVIVDNDFSTSTSHLELNKKQFEFDRVNDAGFRFETKYFDTENPFRKGSYLTARAKKYPEQKKPSWVARYVPDIPKKGCYALYISYGPNPASLSSVEYRVHSANGTDVIRVDQSIGAGTWIYLGDYDFYKGLDPSTGSVELISDDPASITTLDAIKIGGGMGNIARKPELVSGTSDHRNASNADLPAAEIKISAGNIDSKTSGKPRYFEAARYWLQYAGMPDSTVYKLNSGSDDYKDDYQSRGEWVNFLSRPPILNNRSNEPYGLGIPLELSLAFHTDAGIRQSDTIVGTLGIFSTSMPADTFQTGRSKMVNRELTDIIQTQIVSDIHATMDPEWSRRGLWDKPYSEAYRAEVPTILLELLSHQNLADIKFGLDPRFRFIASRAIYKGILKFFAFHENRSFVVQPLPVDHFKIERRKDKMIRLSWQPVTDKLEKSADPKSYDIYIRKARGAFKLLERGWPDTTYDYELPEYDKIFSFKIIAKNEGGKSFPSEILAAGFRSQYEGVALVVNGFDRIDGPPVIDRNDFAGIAFWEDQGVPYLKDFSTVGNPYDFDRNSNWIDDDNPGWGASHADNEGRITLGNTFDFVYEHGMAIMSSGLSFVSCSDETFEQGDFSTDKSIRFIDLLFGEEKTSTLRSDSVPEFQIFTPAMRQQITKLTNQQVPLLISGAHLGTDMIAQKDSAAINFAFNTLHFKWRTNHADRLGTIEGTDQCLDFKSGKWIYNTGFHPDYYTVEAPDAIEPAGKKAFTLLRYSGNKTSAAIAVKGSNKMVVLGFPFESLLSEPAKKDMMRRIIEFLGVEYQQGEM
jgi:hypothetical protein